MSKALYEQEIAAIRSIPDDAIQKPGSIPILIYIQEAENLYNWSQGDKEILTAKGLKWSFVDSIPARAGALREAQSKWVAARNTHENSEKIWSIEAPQAKQLRNELLSAMKFAYRKDSTFKGRLSVFKTGGSYARIIQNLNDLAVIAGENTGPLQEINYDLSNLELAASTSTKMAALLAAVTTERAYCTTVSKIRDQAYTHLKESVDEICSFGRYIFRKNEAKYKRYTCEYSRQIRKRQAAKKEAEEETVPAY